MDLYLIEYDFCWIKLLLYVFFMPNVASILYSSGGLPSHLWSVGAEEQFYFGYPVLVKYAKQHIIKFLIIIPIVYIAFRIILSYIVETRPPLVFKGVSIFNFLLEMTHVFRVDCMAIGGIFAWLLFKQHKLLTIIYSKKTQVVIYVIVLMLIGLKFKLPPIYHTIYSLLFGAITLNLSSNKSTILNFEYPIFNRLGAISYGIYMYHSLIFTMLIDSFNLNGSIITLVLCFVLSFIITLIVSQLSYTYLETPFLKFKHKFSIIISGNDAK
jgi:peptidoglycan/LPS O-acetylase OafA/YrhL